MDSNLECRSYFGGGGGPQGGQVHWIGTALLYGDNYLLESDRTPRISKFEIFTRIVMTKSRALFQARSVSKITSARTSAP